MIHSPIFYEGSWMHLIRRTQEKQPLLKTRLQPRRQCLFSGLEELPRKRQNNCITVTEKKQLKIINMQVKGKKSQDDKKRCTVTQTDKVKEDGHSVTVQRQTSNKYHVHR